MALFRKLLGVPKAASVGKRKGRAFVAPPGQQAYTTGGTYSFVAPAGVTSVSVVAVGIGAGGSGGRDATMNGGGGGALAYTNNITVIPGNSYSVNIPCHSSGTPGRACSSFVCNPIARTGGAGAGLDA